ncbi:MAG TPA: portal protein, partial [Accumulibacter sp.]|nr:portal protein [Accumulibacter sp.]
MKNKSRVLTTWDQLKSERSSWISHWKEISDYLLPRSGRFFGSDRNIGVRRHNSIYDSTGTRALRVLAAGMMSGMTSPARPWFRLSVNDPDLAKVSAVKLWLNDVTSLMHTIFQKSNTYRALHAMYEELGAFGTAASLVTADYHTVIRHYPLTVGEYCLATNWHGEVTTIYREFQKTVREMVGEFGYERVSTSVRNLYDRGSLEEWITVIHAVEQRSDRDTRHAGNRQMPWKSVYFEIGSDADKPLRESGFRRFPALCPRWSTSGGDIYGNSPGMEALGDIKQLQHEQLRKAQGIDKMTNPPLQVPSAMKNREVDMLPGGVSYVDMAGANSAIRTLFDVRIDLSHLLADIQDVRHRIDWCFYADLFLMLANQTDARMTAT